MNKKDFNVWSLSFELGYLIALPLVLCTFLGRFIDKTYHASPLFLLIGVLFAISISTFLVYQKTKNILK